MAKLMRKQKAHWTPEVPQTQLWQCECGSKTFHIVNPNAGRDGECVYTQCVDCTQCYGIDAYNADVFTL